MTEASKASKVKKCPYGFICGNIGLNMPYSQLLKPKNKRCEHRKDCSALVKTLSASSDTIEEFLANLEAIIKEDEQKIKEEILESLANNAAYGESGTTREQELFEKLLNPMREYREKVSLDFKDKVLQYETAVSYLKKYGNHQPFETFGIDKQMLSIKDLLKQLRSNLKNLQWGYIAPKGANVNCNQNQCPKTFRLKSNTAQFESTKQPGKKVKTISLGEDTYHHNYQVIQARIGIERRQRLQEIHAKLIEATTALQEAADIADVSFDFNHPEYTFDFDPKAHLINSAKSKAERESLLKSFEHM